MATTNPRPASETRLVSGFALPPALDHLADEIERSRVLLGLADDWDDAGSPGYAEATWHRAIGFLVGTATRLWDERGVALDGADVLPGSRGGIDIELRTADRRLLISVSGDSSAPARYFGHDTRGTEKVKGYIHPDQASSFLVAFDERRDTRSNVG